jgi:hypothetical protein
MYNHGTVPSRSYPGCVRSKAKLLCVCECLCDLRVEMCIFVGYLEWCDDYVHGCRLTNRPTACCFCYASEAFCVCSSCLGELSDFGVCPFDVVGA